MYGCKEVKEVEDARDALISLKKIRVLVKELL